MATNWTGLLGWLFGRPDPNELAMLRDPSAAVRQGLTRARQAASQGLVNVAEGRAPFGSSIDPVHAARNAPQGFARGLLQGAQGAYEALPAWAAPGKLLNQTAPPMADTLLPIPGQVRQNPSAMSGVNAGQAFGNLAFEMSPLADIRDAQQAAQLAREHPLEAGLMVGAAAIPFAPELMKGARAGVNAVVSPRVGRSGMAGVLTFHGTPHTWAPEPGFPHGRPRYDASTALTGEGAQAYGAGFYSAEAPGVARQYQESLAREGTFMLKGKPYPFTPGWDETNSPEGLAAWYASTYPDLGEARKELAARFAPYEDMVRGGGPLAQKVKPQLENARKALEYLEDEGTRFVPGGNLYELDIPDELVPKYLEWDKPLSEQSEEVQSALKSAFGMSEDAQDYWRNALIDDLAKNGPSGYSQDRLERVIDEFMTYGEYGDEFGTSVLDELREAAPELADEFIDVVSKQTAGGIDPTDPGSSVYKLIAAAKGGDAKASEYLRQAGIPGIRFLDRGSRGAGQGTYNYVTFAPQDIVKQVRRLGDAQ